MSELLDLTDKVDLASTATLRSVHEVASSLNLPYVIVGATARDLIMHHGYGAPIRSATEDIDFGIQVSSWHDFNAMGEKLLQIGFNQGRQPHRFISPTDIPIDIVPFGAIESDNANIRWPPDNAIIMSMRGFQEAIENAQQVIIQKNPDVICLVVTPEGFMMLKLISWADRSREKRDKDANDIQYLLTNYSELEYVKTEIYAENNKAELEHYNYDQTYTACSLLGKNCREITYNATAKEILKLHNIDNEKNLERIVQEMSHGLANKNLNCLEAFMTGFQLENPESLG